MTQRLDVMYASDDRYAHYAHVSLASLLSSNLEIRELNIFYIESGLSPTSKRELTATADKYGRRLEFVPLRDIIGEFRLADNFPRAAYARLGVGTLPTSTRLVYLDADTIVLDSLTDLIGLDLKGAPAAAVLDVPGVPARAAVGLAPDEPYYNSGVLLIDPNEWRRQCVADRLVSFIDRNKGRVVHEDQGVLNGVLSSELHCLPPEYNLMPQFYTHTAHQLVELFHLADFYSQEAIDHAVSAPKVIHYIRGFMGRPWERNCKHPRLDDYLAAERLTGTVKEAVKPPQNLRLAVRRHAHRILPFPAYKLIEQLLDIRRRHIIENR